RAQPYPDSQVSTCRGSYRHVAHRIASHGSGHSILPALAFPYGKCACRSKSTYGEPGNGTDCLDYARIWPCYYTTSCNGCLLCDGHAAWYYSARRLESTLYVCTE